MKPRKLFSISEHGYLLNAVDAKRDKNAVGIPSTAFKYLLSSLHDEQVDSEISNFLQLTTYNRKPALKVKNYAGVLQASCGTQVEILPKLYSDSTEEISRVALLKMLKTLRNSPYKSIGIANVYDAKMPLLEAYILQFLGLVNDLVKKGIRSDYVSERKNARFLKGRLLLAQQLRVNHFQLDRFYIENDEYQVNRPANRLVKSTLILIGKLARSSKNQRLAKELSFVFHEVPASEDIDTDFMKVKTGRSMAYYNDVLSWCRFLLRGHGPTAISGQVNTFSLLYPMERLFEDYVAHCLRKNMDKYFSADCSLGIQKKSKYLVEDHRDKKMFNMRPDMLVIHETKVVSVLDAKWKLIDSDNRSKKYGISQPDMYQLYAYGHKYLQGCDKKELMLIYPKSQNFSRPLSPFTYEQDFTLRVVPFDVLSGELIL